MFVRGERQLHAVVLEERRKGLTHREIRAVLTASAERRTMVEGDLPGLAGGGLQIRCEPGQLRSAPARVLKRPLRVEGDEMDRAVVETVVALGVIAERTKAGVRWEREQIEVRFAPVVRRTGIVVAGRREERAPTQPRAVDVEEPRLVRRVA